MMHSNKSSPQTIFICTWGKFKQQLVLLQLSCWPSWGLGRVFLLTVQHWTVMADMRRRERLLLLVISSLEWLAALWVPSNGHSEAASRASFMFTQPVVIWTPPTPLSLSPPKCAWVLVDPLRRGSCWRVHPFYQTAWLTAHKRTRVLPLHGGEAERTCREWLEWEWEWEWEQAALQALGSPHALLWKCWGDCPSKSSVFASSGSKHPLIWSMQNDPPSTEKKPLYASWINKQLGNFGRIYGI